MAKNQKLLILGSSGLIGSACVRYAKMKNIANLLIPTHAELDILDGDVLKKYMNRHRPGMVILAAAKVGGIMPNKTYPADFITTNLLIQVNTFNAALKAGVKQLIFFGSSCMYPRECAQPMKEEAILTGKPEPTSLSYALAKLAGIQMCDAYNKQYKQTQFISLIPNSAYGANDNFDLESAHVLSALIRRFHEAKVNKQNELILWGSGRPRREFVFSDDVASAVFTVLEADQLDVPMNIGVGKDYSIKELSETIKKVVGYPGEIKWDTSKPDGAPQKLLDNSKILTLGWKPAIDLETGIKKTYRWFLENYKND